MISKAMPQDAAALDRLVNSAYRGERSKQGWTTEADLLDGIRTDEASLTEMLLKHDAAILKYVNEAGELHGCVYLEKQGDKMYLGMLTVAPQLQNGGIGKQLLQAAEMYAQKHGATAVVMSVISVRHELIRWYERHGYQQTGATKPFPMQDPRFGMPKQELEFLIMEKPLTGAAPALIR